MLILSNIKCLYDGSSLDKNSVHQKKDIFIDNGLIHDIKDHNPQLEVGEAHSLVDLSDCTVTPGLIDCHGHISALGLNQKDLDRSNTVSMLLYVEKILYRTLVDGGVTTVRDVGGATYLMKKHVDDGLIIGPRLKIAICMLSTTGGHADFRGPDRCHATISSLWPEMPGRPSSIVDGPWDCRKRVREIAACGGDLIKICASPGVASPHDKLEHQDFGPEEIEAICSEAAARGLQVAAHAHSQNGIELAIRYGVKDIQHISFMDERLVEMAHDKDCTVTPTSWVLEEVLKADLAPAVHEKAKQTLEHHALAVQYAAKGGLRILAGSDAVFPGMHGKNYLELHHLIREGLSPLQAWYGATGLAAKEIGLDDSGTLKKGQRADLLIGSGDVIDNPKSLGDGALLEVMKDGVGYRGLDGIPQRTFRDTTLMYGDN